MPKSQTSSPMSVICRSSYRSWPHLFFYSLTKASPQMSTQTRLNSWTWPDVPTLMRRLFQSVRTLQVYPRMYFKKITLPLLKRRISSMRRKAVILRYPYSILIGYSIKMSTVRLPPSSLTISGSLMILLSQMKKSTDSYLTQSLYPQFMGISSAGTVLSSSKPCLFLSYSTLQQLIISSHSMSWSMIGRLINSEKKVSLCSLCS